MAQICHLNTQQVRGKWPWAQGHPLLHSFCLRLALNMRHCLKYRNENEREKSWKNQRASDCASNISISVNNINYSMATIHWLTLLFCSGSVGLWSMCADASWLAELENGRHARSKVERSPQDLLTCSIFLCLWQHRRPLNKFTRISFIT